MEGWGTKAQSRFIAGSVECKYLIIILNSKTVHSKLKVKKWNLENEATATGKLSNRYWKMKYVENS